VISSLTAAVHLAVQPWAPLTPRAVAGCPGRRGVTDRWGRPWRPHGLTSPAVTPCL